MLRSLLTQLSSELSGQTCMDHVQNITRHHRIQASPGYRAAANDCLRTLVDAGLQATITTYPATGRNRAWTNLTPQEWACTDAELWLLDAAGNRQERLAWFQEMNLSIIQRSCATPADGVSAELVAVEHAEEPSSWLGVAAHGKIALVGNGDIHRIWTNALRAGAVGLITARMTYHAPTRPPGDLPDALQYTSFWWTEGQPRGWGFVLSTRQGDRLHHLLKSGAVRLWAKVDAHFVDGTIENVEAVIPGRSTQEVLVISHLCHPRPSANDNATGPATVMEVARTLQRLISLGQLAPPERTIRFLFPPEMTGTYAHLAARSQADLNRIVGALNVDMVGQNQDLTGSVLFCEYPPLSCPSFGGDLLRLVFQEATAESRSFYGTKTGYALFRHAVTSFVGGSDHEVVSDPSVGIPCPAIGQWPDRFYHTSADTIDKVDPSMMKRVGCIIGAYTYFLASAGLSEATWLATEMAVAFAQKLHHGLHEQTNTQAAIAFRTSRALTDLDSLRRLVAPSDQGAFAQVLDTCRSQIRIAEEMEIRRCALLDKTSVAEPQRDSLIQGWTGVADLRTIRPARTYPGPISLRNYIPLLPQAEADSWYRFTDAHRDTAHIAYYLCYWADGVRSLAEIVELTALETGIQDHAWSLGYFQLLAQLGLVTGV